MGDFNNNINNKKLLTRHLLNKLQESGLTSLLDFNNITEHTWSRDNSRSQIDDIWTSYLILLDVTESKLTTADESTKSDHKILSIEWNTGISLKSGRKKCSKKKIYLYDKVTADDWTKFSDDLIKKMDKLQLHAPNIQNENYLNKYWNT
ncbi:5238_t:CDS:1 [Gigaspora margarita]|uniref:5238_t:CDS:1 n=1 Tax=Gigaspora margarita TaxID=4874 RepID=A0ABN7VC11_GIGMA|nr:5238_t:CDS:1 [Gigaspora margarita]